MCDKGCLKSAVNWSVGNLSQSTNLASGDYHIIFTNSEYGK